MKTSEFKQLLKEEVQKEIKKQDLLEQKEKIENELNEILKEEDNGWPKKIEKGKFTTYCHREGFKDGAGISCARHAMKSDDASVRGMASFYMNTVKPEGKNAKDLEEEIMNEAKPSSGLSKEKKSEVVKAAKKGEDIGKPGKGFKDVEAKAKKYGAKNPESVAASVMWKNIKR